MKKIVLFVACLIFALNINAQVPFHRGVNLTGWFQAENARKIQFRKFKKKDFNDIKSLGCDVIRLPINLHGMTLGAPNYTIDPLFLSFLDSAVYWAEELNLYLLIDNHSFDPSTNTSPEIVEILIKVWPQLAERYKDRSDYIIYEVLNEPHGIDDNIWGSIQQQAIDAIRSKDTKHQIVVGPAGWNGYNNLAQMPIYSDSKLIYTFHFYDPFMFTHQGASWNTPSMVSLAGVPFPYNSATMPSCPPDLKGSWVEQALNSYPSQGNVDYVKSLIDIAVNFKNNNHVNIFCGEFGVYTPNCNANDRVYWYKVVKEYLEEKEIPWTTWDYKGSFGLFNKGSNEIFESDLNIPLLQALGLNVPPQHTHIQHPDSVGLRIYDDFVEQNIIDVSYSSSTIDFYSTLFPNNDNYCLYWAGGQQFSTISLDFVPDRDFTRLANSNFAIDFMVRGNTSTIKFDIRFMDSKTTDPQDHPWRMRTTLYEGFPAWDKKWHHIFIPLKDFTEHGSWDNGSWFNPEGKFDWSAVDKFEIVSEYGSNTGKEIWFDNIVISDLDTAQINELGTLGIKNEIIPEKYINLSINPNPMSTLANISYQVKETSLTRLSIFNITGQLIVNLIDQILPRGNYTLEWHGKDCKGEAIPNGFYFCELASGNYRKCCKFVKYAS